MKDKFTSYEDVSRTIFGEKYNVFDRTVIYTMKNGNIAKIVLSTRSKSGIFVGYKLTIINPKFGVIDGKFFNFNHFMQDGEIDYAIKEYTNTYFEWTTQPTEVQVKNYVKQILSYIQKMDTK